MPGSSGREWSGSSAPRCGGRRRRTSGRGAAAMKDEAVTAASLGLVSCEACQLLSRPANRPRAGLLPPLRRKAGIPPREVDREHVGPGRRGDHLLHPGQRAPDIHHDDAGRGRARHDIERRGVSLHVRVVAACAHRADRERDDSARQARCARLPADHGAARLDRQQSRAHAALSNRRIHRPVVDARRVRGGLYRRAGAAPATDIGRARVPACCSSPPSSC